ncbi:HD-GYP domain-containing protein [Xanthomonas hydrangeae]|uniref:HD-GYP domain-containing protein n=1 Tax=Xanthomonas hydrangeae TaxID=2775159 RepID=A0AAU0BGC0_9XANT|nr:HD-GYP domain-containing protein [Xanthomonas hydrangeae]WOB50946.1 HD-GYP domain-containing protein [Xanthomonas hydrangeae]CAD7713025.1 Cyclic di-GMP phosphodiesterase [Xanthomonas hydrangeae]CAD7713026.1 Cyclic di-GMP phosphodiesterase [Xanthomonas hydrangeae]CAD7718629.1 Cyclic di-GMP phosphodiesterase [Xanthomonas hydrangeae]CAD7718631.1 Cyclic di-GMP phosphodiesterase [Xanthomonas hydrangeae]
MLRTIDSDQLRPGMYVYKLLGAWVHHPFWKTSFLVDSDDVDKIHGSRIEQLVIDTARGLDLEAPAAAHAASDAAPEPELPEPSEPPKPACTSRTARTNSVTAQVGIESEVVRARKIFEDGRDMVEAMFRDVRLGRTVDTEAAMPLVQAINDSVLRHPQALISVARLKTADDYTYLHSMAVAGLMSGLARQLGLPEAQVVEAAMGGLLHDMGKAVTPLDILNKPGKLTDEEMDIMRQHPMDGHRLLVAGGVQNAVVLEIALHHHEKMDGTGYPNQLAGETISLMSRMGAVCDVYDAISSDRPYKRAWDPAESLKRMASWQGHFDPAVFQAFVRRLGIYPVGSLVRLESQKLAVVIEQTADALLKPKVRVFYSAKLRSHVLVQDIDLSRPDCQDRIAQMESPTDWGFRDLEKLWLP